MDITPSQILYMAKGFSWIFWGLLLNMVLFFGDATIEFFHILRIPAYVIGSVLIGWGLFVLRDTGGISHTWLRLGRIAIVLVCLEIYFAPFTEWWRNMPYVSFYMINCLGLLLAGMLTLFYINLLVAEGSRCLNDREGQIESKLLAAGVALLMIVPLLVSVAFAAIAAIRYQTSFYMEIWHILNWVSPWVYVFVIISCSLTLVASWKARSRCYHELVTRKSETEA